MSFGPPKPFHYAPPMEPYLEVLHRDDDMLVLSKPSGLLHVPGKPAEHADCLEARAQAAFPSAMTVHRLDKDTSGVVVMGLNRKAHAHLSQQFETRQTRKVYIARVWGFMTEESGHIDLPIACDWPNRPKQMVDRENGRPRKRTGKSSRAKKWQRASSCIRRRGARTSFAFTCSASGTRFWATISTPMKRPSQPPTVYNSTRNI